MANLKAVFRPSDVGRDGTAPIFIRITQNRKVKFLNSGMRCSASDWDFRSNEPKNKNLKLYLDKIILKLQEQAIKDGGFNLKRIRIGKDEPASILEFGETIIDELTRAGRVGNAKTYRSALNQIEKRMSGIELFEDLTYQVLLNFRIDREAEGLSPNSIRAYLVAYRYLFNEAKRRDVIGHDINPFCKGLIPRPVKSRRGFLSKEEVKLLESYKTNHKWKRRAVDILLLGYYLRGMDFIDMVSCSKAVNGYVQYRRTKLNDGKPLVVKVDPRAEKIIKRYKHGTRLTNIIPHDPKDKEVFYTSRSSVLKSINKNARLVGEELGIKHKLTTKIMRHTFATHAKLRGYSREIIAEMMGHNWNTTTDTYLGEYPQDVIDEAHLSTIL